MRFEDFETGEDLVALAEDQNYDKLLEEAVRDAEQALEVEAEELELEVGAESAGGAEYDPFERRVGVNPEAPAELRAEGVYEEVFHILGFNEAHKRRHGEPRKGPEERNFWEDCADEVVGGIARWHPEFGFDRSLERGYQELSELGQLRPEELSHKDNEIAYSAAHHLVGYSISKAAEEQGYDPADVASMSYDEIREEFSGEVLELREELADEHGIHLDLDQSFVQPIDSSEEQAPAIYIEAGEKMVGYGRFGSESGETAEADWYRFNRDSVDYLPTVE